MFSTSSRRIAGRKQHLWDVFLGERPFLLSSLVTVLITSCSALYILYVLHESDDDDDDDDEHQPLHQLRSVREACERAQKMDSITGGVAECVNFSTARA